MPARVTSDLLLVGSLPTDSTDAAHTTAASAACTAAAARTVGGLGGISLLLTKIATLSACARS